MMGSLITDKSFEFRLFVNLPDPMQQDRSITRRIIDGADGADEYRIRFFIRSPLIMSNLLLFFLKRFMIYM